MFLSTSGITYILFLGAVSASYNFRNGLISEPLLVNRLVVDSTDPQPQLQSNWTVQGCIMLSMNVSLVLPLESNLTETLQIDPSRTDVKASGNCSSGNNTQMLMLTWTDVNKINASLPLKRSMMFTITANTTEEIYGVEMISGMAEVYTRDNKTNTTVEQVLEFSHIFSPRLFLTKINNSYSCLTSDDFSIEVKEETTTTAHSTTKTTPTTTKTTPTTTKTTPTTTKTTPTTTKTTPTTTKTTPTTTKTTPTTTVTTPTTTVTTPTTTVTTPTTTVTTPTTTETAPSTTKTTPTTTETAKSNKERFVRSVNNDDVTTTVNVTTTAKPTTVNVTTTAKPTTVNVTTTAKLTTVKPPVSRNLTLSFKNIKFDAFRLNSTKPEEFQAACDCAADAPVNDIIPIVVGAVLAGLIVITLVAYLIGRKYNQGREYTNME